MVIHFHDTVWTNYKIFSRTVLVNYITRAHKNNVKCSIFSKTVPVIDKDIKNVNITCR